MEKTHFATSNRSKHRRLSTLALANVVMMAEASKATPDAASTTPAPAPSTTTPAPKSTTPAKPATPAADSSTDSSTMNEVVVSAKQDAAYQTETSGNGKYTQPLLDTPQTITVIPKQLIKDQNATTLQQALQNVPGITFGAGEGGTLPGDNITIRGFNAQQDIFIDGFRDTGIYNRDPFNLDQVEVVEGPASAYSGFGSTGGSVNIVTKTPTLSPFYEISSGYGTNQYYRETADINQPLNGVLPGASFRLNALYQFNNFAERDNIYNSRWGANPEFAFGLGTDTRITLSYLFLQEQDLPTFGLPIVNAAGVAANPSLASQVGHVAPVNYSNFYGFVNRDYENTSTHMPTLKLEHDFDEHLKISNLSRYGQTYLNEITTPPRFDAGAYGLPNGKIVGSAATLAPPLGDMTREERGRQQTDSIWGNQTLVNTDFDTWMFHHDMVLTAEATEQSENARTLLSDTGVTQNNSFNANEITSLGAPNAFDPYPYRIVWGPETRTQLNDYSFSMFDSIKLTKQLILSGGMRYDHLDTSAQNPATATAPFYTAKETNDLASWRAALNYKPAENGSIYFGYGTSYNPSIQGAASDSSSPDGLTSSTANLEPESDETYELGTKWNVLHDQVTLTADLFRTLKDNTRIADPNNVGQYILAGATRVQGIDVGAQGSLTKDWKVFAGYTYLQSKIMSSPTPGASGNKLPFTPNQSASVWMTYDLPENWEIGTGVQFSDKQFGSTLDTTSVKGYAIQQMMVSYELNKHFSFQLNVYNLWDDHYIAVFGNGGAVPGAGRSVTFTSTLKF